LRFNDHATELLNPRRRWPARDKHEMAPAIGDGELLRPLPRVYLHELSHAKRLRQTQHWAEVRSIADDDQPRWTGCRKRGQHPNRFASALLWDKAAEEAKHDLVG
jgi:hypothetical protein